MSHFEPLICIYIIHKYSLNVIITNNIKGLLMSTLLNISLNLLRVELGGLVASLHGWPGMWLHMEWRRKDKNVYVFNNIYLVISSLYTRGVTLKYLVRNISRFSLL